MKSKYIQADGEKKRYNIDYSDWLDSGETVSSVAYSVSPTTSPPLVVSSSSIDPNNTGVTFYVSGGVNTNTYKVIVTMTSNGGQIKEDAVTFAINNP